ncbi:MAG: BatD family protein [Verrucomicrobiae bacterium]
MKPALPILAALFLAATSLCAQEIVAGLSSSRAQVGEPVQLVVTIRGARGADVPQTLAVDGLRINLAGRSTQFEMRNFKMSSSLTYTYMIVPQFEGEFTIPSFGITIEGKTYPTQAMRLAVSGSAIAPQIPSLPQNASPLPPGTAGSPQNNGRPFFGELVLAKKSAYAGEVVPIELRFYFNTRISGQVSERPIFSGEGFTVQKFSNAVKRDQVIGGTNYSVFSFQSAITPVKSGTLEIPAASLEARLKIPGKAPQGLDDFFSNLPLPQGMFAEDQDVKVESGAQKLEVTALPKDGRPEDFSGAVGKFTMEASVSPRKAAAGEPVTLRVTVSGQGNFEGMGAPALSDDEGWRTYPPSDKFQSADAIGFTGEKTFEFAIVARQDQSRTPGARLSYFDPSTGKYATLIQAPLPVDARAGAAAPPAAPQQAAAPADTPPPASAPTPDITAMSGGTSSWSALFFRKGFLAANAAIALAWLAVVIVFSVRRFSASPAGRNLARKKLARQAFVRLAGADPEVFYDEVIRFLSLRLNAPGDHASLSERIESSSFPEEIKASLLRSVERHAESKFAAGRVAAPSADERSCVLATLKDLRHEK